MGVAEHLTNGAVGWASEGLVGGPPLQIRKNPFSAGASALPLTDSRIYLRERAYSIGRFDLFTLEALDLIVDGSRSVPSELRSIAQLAFFAAASEGAYQIQSRHVTNALASLVPFYPAINNIGGVHKRPDGVSGTQREPVLDSSPVFEEQSAVIAEATRFSGRQEDVEALSGASDDLHLHAIPNLEVTDDAPAASTSHTLSASRAVTASDSTEKPEVRGRHRVRRSVGIGGVLVASFFVAGAISSNLMRSSPVSTGRALPSPAAHKTLDVAKAIVQEPTLVKEPANLSVPEQGVVQEGTSQAQAGAEPSASEAISMPAPKSAGAANRVTRKKRVAALTAAPSLAEIGAPEERGAQDPVKPDDVTIDTAQQVIPANEAAQQAASVRDAEKRAEAEKAAARVAEEKAAAKKTVAEILAGERAPAIEDSAIQAQPAANKAQIERDAADRSKAEAAAKKDKGGLRFGANGIRIF